MAKLQVNDDKVLTEVHKGYHIRAYATEWTAGGHSRSSNPAEYQQRATVGIRGLQFPKAINFYRSARCCFGPDQGTPKKGG
jgi:hypothetical protein